MALNVSDSFNRTTAQPPFIGMIFADTTARDAFSTGLRYQGMECFTIADGLYWSLIGGTANANWVERTGGGSGSGILVVDDVPDLLAIDDADRYDGLLVYVIDEQDLFQLRGGIDDADFVSFEEIYVQAVTTHNVVYANDNTGAQVPVTYQSAAGPGTIPLRGAQNQILADLPDDGDVNASSLDLVNRGYVGLFKGDRTLAYTASNGATKVIQDFTDILLVSGATIAGQTFELISDLTSYRRVTLQFASQIDALVITPGTHGTGPAVPNTVNWYPKSVKAGDVLIYAFDPVTFAWTCISYFSVASPMQTKPAAVTLAAGVMTFLDTPYERILAKGATGGGTVMTVPNGTRDGQKKLLIGTNSDDNWILQPASNLLLGSDWTFYLGTTLTISWATALTAWVVEGSASV